MQHSLTRSSTGIGVVPDRNPHPVLACLMPAKAGLRTGILLALLPILLAAPRAATQSNSLDEARRLFAAGSYDRASGLLEKQLKAHPQDADAHLLLGQVYALQGRRAEAIQELSRTIELRPGSAVAYNMLGTALDRFAEFDAARKAFEQAVALDPTLVEAHINFAMSLAESGDLQGAAGQLTAAIQLQPNSPSAARAHYLLAKIYEDQENGRALNELEAASKIDPQDEQTWLELGSLKSESGDESRRAGCVPARRRMQSPRRRISISVGLGISHRRRCAPGCRSSGTGAQAYAQADARAALQARQSAQENRRPATGAASARAGANTARTPGVAFTPDAAAKRRAATVEIEQAVERRLAGALPAARGAPRRRELVRALRPRLMRSPKAAIFSARKGRAMHWNLWLGFAAAAFVIGVIPGPAVTSIVGYALGSGAGRRWRRSPACRSAA